MYFSIPCTVKPIKLWNRKRLLDSSYDTTCIQNHLTPKVRLSLHVVKPAAYAPGCVKMIKSQSISCFRIYKSWTLPLILITFRDFNEGKLDHRDMNVYEQVYLRGIVTQQNGYAFVLQVKSMRKVKVYIFFWKVLLNV